MMVQRRSSLFLSIIPGVIVLVCLAGYVHSKTRGELAAEANSYSSISWLCNSANIYDLNSDGFDDRPGCPFQSGQTYTGVAYANAHWDTLSQFATKLNSMYLAGRGSSDTVLSDGCQGYTGIDSNGYISRILGITNINSTWEVTSIPRYCVRLDKPGDVKPGDFLVRAGNTHVLIYEEGINTSTISFCHATKWSYETGQAVSRVLREQCQFYRYGNLLLVKDQSSGGQLVEHIPYSAFPVFNDDFLPRGEVTTADPNGADVAITFSIRSNLPLTTIEITLNGQTFPSSNVAMTQSTTKSSTFNISCHPGSLLPAGTYTVNVRAINEKSLEDSSQHTFTVITGL